ncbi:hypothetical protein EDB85DRAFT_2018151 [Lactarius pseudohatsudake]|nr:hypothetical protein EDB85DRAFT_2018151 [Lactarius pseudohatsudake]
MTQSTPPHPVAVTSNRATSPPRGQPRPSPIRRAQAPPNTACKTPRPPTPPPLSNMQESSHDTDTSPPLSTPPHPVAATSNRATSPPRGQPRPSPIRCAQAPPQHGTQDPATANPTPLQHGTQGPPRRRPAAHEPHYAPAPRPRPRLCHHRHVAPFLQ